MAQQSHAQIIDALAAITRQIPGILVSYGSTNLPQSLVTFPATVVLLGPDDYGRLGICEYLIRVFVADVKTGTPSNAYSQCLSLSTSFHNTFNPLIYVGDRFVERKALSLKLGFGNTGFAQTLKWGAQSCYGFSVNVPLISAVPGN